MKKVDVAIYRVEKTTRNKNICYVPLPYIRT